MIASMTMQSAGWEGILVWFYGRKMPGDDGETEKKIALGTRSVYADDSRKQGRDKFRTRLN